MPGNASIGSAPTGFPFFRMFYGITLLNVKPDLESTNMSDNTHTVTEICFHDIPLFNSLDIVAYTTCPGYVIWIMDIDGNDYYIDEDIEDIDMMKSFPSAAGDGMQHIHHRGVDYFFYPDKFNSLRKKDILFPEDSCYSDWSGFFVTILKGGTIEGESLLLGGSKVNGASYYRAFKIYVIGTTDAVYVYDFDLKPILPPLYGCIYFKPVGSGNGIDSLHYLIKRKNSLPDKAEDSCHYETSLLDSNQNVLFTFPNEVWEIDYPDRELFVVEREDSPFVIDNRGELISRGEKIHLTKRNKARYKDYFVLSSCFTFVSSCCPDAPTGRIEKWIRTVQPGQRVSSIKTDCLMPPPEYIWLWKAE